MILWSILLLKCTTLETCELQRDLPKAAETWRGCSLFSTALCLCWKLLEKLLSASSFKSQVQGWGEAVSHRYYTQPHPHTPHRAGKSLTMKSLTTPPHGNLIWSKKPWLSQPSPQDRSFKQPHVPAQVWQWLSYLCSTTSHQVYNLPTFPLHGFQ